MGLNEIIQIGSNIKQLRIKKGISQKCMAEEYLKINRTTYSNYENNNRVPDNETLEKIANALDVTVNDLAGINKIEIKTNSTFKEAFSQFIADKRYLLDVKNYDSIEEYNECLENLYNATIEYIEFYCYKLKWYYKLNLAKEGDWHGTPTKD